MPPARSTRVGADDSIIICALNLCFELCVLVFGLWPWVFGLGSLILDLRSQIFDFGVLDLESTL